MTWRVARSLDVLLEQINRRYPTRSKASDGSIGDADHQNRNSDHNPWYGPGIVTARDITHDPGVGLDMDELTDQLRAGRDPRLKYAIYNRWIMDSRPGYHPWQWVRYHGSNPHTKHVHVSVVASSPCDNTDPWDLPMLGAEPVPSIGNLSLGSRGGAVAELQRRLNAWYPWIKLAEDGVFGPATQGAVRDLQRRAGLTEDGIVGPATRVALKLPA